MARLTSELGADVIDDTIPEKKRKFSAKKRNYIIGLSCVAVLAIVVGVIYYMAVNVWLYDYQNMSYITYTINVEPDTDGPYAGQVTASIKSVSSDSDYPSTFKIPNKINGYVITGIDDNAFQGCTRLKTVIMPDSITSIGEKAFINCTNLTTIEFSSQLTKIGNNAFEGTAFKDSWSNYEAYYINDILVYVNEDKLLSDHNATSIVFVDDENSSLINEYPNSVAYSLTTLSVVEAGQASTSDVSINQWMDGLFSDFDSLVAVEIPSYLSAVPNNSFQDCANLEKVIFSNENTTIEDYAFDNCTSLSEANLEGNENITTIGSYVFRNADLDISSLPTNLSSLGSYAFYGNTDITSMEIPSSLTSIPSYCFYNTSISSITYENENAITAIGDYAFYGTEFTTFEFPKNVSTIATGVLQNCENLVSVTMYENGPTRLNGGAFAYNENFTSIKTLDDDGNVTSRCTSDTTAYIPQSVVRTSNSSTGAGTFQGTSIEKVIIPSVLTRIAEHCFEDCTKLQEVVFDDYDNSVLRSINNYAFTGCTSLTEITIPNLVHTIGTYVFQNCTSLTTVHLPEATVWDDGTYGYQYNIATSYGSSGATYYTTIKEYVFSGCTSLTTVNIPSTVTKISNYAFENCTSLYSLSVPANVSSISSNAFAGCSVYIASSNTYKPNTWTTGWDNGVAGVAYGSQGIFESGDYVISINSDDRNTVTLVDYIPESVPTTVELPSSITHDGVTYTVTGINDNFMSSESFASVTEVILPSTLTSLGSGAFSGCTLTTTVSDGYQYLGSASNPYFALVGMDETATEFSINSNVQVVDYSAFDSSVLQYTIDDYGVYYLSSGDNDYFLLASTDNTSRVTDIEVNTACEFIASYAFNGYTRLTSITIPNSVTHVSQHAFYNCTNLSIYCEATDISEGWDFNWNPYDSDAFWATTGPISNSAFGACKNLDGTSARITSYKGSSGTVEIPETISDGSASYTVTQIASEFLSGNSSVTSLYIPSSVVTIEENAIEDCPALTIYCQSSSALEGWDENWNPDNSPVYYGIVNDSSSSSYNHYVSDSVDYVLDSSSSTAIVTGYQSGITNTVIPSTITVNNKTYTVTAIGEKAFAYATTMPSITIPSTVTTFGDNAFIGCSSLTIYLESSSAPSTFDEANPNERPYYLGINESNFTTVDGVEYVISNGEATATSYESTQVNVVIADTVTVNGTEYPVTKVGRCAFQNDTILATLTIGSNVTTIEDQAFSGCTGRSFTYVVIPESVVYMGSKVFEYCEAITVYIVAEEIPSTWAEDWDFLSYVSGSTEEYDVIFYYVGLDSTWQYNEDTNIPEVITEDEEE